MPTPVDLHAPRRRGSFEIAALAALATLAACHTSTPPEAEPPVPEGEIRELALETPAALVDTDSLPENLTIDGQLQTATEAALEAATGPGAAVVIDAESGDVLAIHEVAGRTAHPARHSMMPASTVKPLLSAVALEDGVIEANTQHDCTGSVQIHGRSYTCFHVHGETNLTTGLATSCNSFFYRVADDLGFASVRRGFDRFGLGHPSGWELEESAGTVPASVPEGDEIAVAIGHGPLSVTPLQMARAYAALATGELPSLRVDRNSPQIPPVDLGFDEVDRQRVLEGLVAAVATPQGTGDQARVEGLNVAGKTGTAHAPGGGASSDAPSRLDGWFAGFAPAEQPQVVVIVFIEGAGSGGHTAAPVAGKILAAWHDAR